jgi:raffinose/stachyose/melibiose transport system substrate-binding protein
MFMFPADAAADSRITVQPSGGIALWVDSKNKDAANTFLDFMSRDEEMQKFATANNILTAKEANSGQLSGTYTELNDAFKAGLAIPDPTASWPNTSMNEKIGASVQGLFTGQKTVDQVLADMDTYFEAE